MSVGEANVALPDDSVVVGPGHPATPSWVSWPRERFEGLGRLAYAAAYDVIRKHEDAEDVAQAALAMLFFKWSTVLNPEGFVWMTAHHAALALVTKGFRSREIPIDPADFREAQSDGEIDAVIGNLFVEEHLVGLSPQQRVVLEKRITEDLRPVTIAELLGVSPAVVKTHMKRALKKLRTRFGRRA
jgi:RNA polymerase sigma factor (sigma-70 family)